MLMDHNSSCANPPKRQVVELCSALSAHRYLGAVTSALQTNARGTQYRTAALAQVQHYCTQLEAMLAQAATMQTEAERLLPLQPPTPLDSGTGSDDDSGTGSDDDDEIQMLYPEDDVTDLDREAEGREGGFDAAAGLGAGLMSHGCSSSPSWSLEGESLSLASGTEGANSYCRAGSAVSGLMSDMLGSVVCSPGAEFDASVSSPTSGFVTVQAADVAGDSPADDIATEDGPVRGVEVQREGDNAAEPLVDSSTVAAAAATAAVSPPPASQDAVSWDDEDVDEESSCLLANMPQIVLDSLDSFLARPVAVAGHVVECAGSSISGGESEGESHEIQVPTPLAAPSQLYSPLPADSISDSGSISMASTASLFSTPIPSVTAAAFTPAGITTPAAASSSLTDTASIVMPATVTTAAPLASGAAPDSAITAPCTAAEAVCSGVSPGLARGDITCDDSSYAAAPASIAPVRPSSSSTPSAATDRAPPTAVATTRDTKPATPFAVHDLPFDYSSGFLQAMSQADPSEPTMDESFMSTGDSQTSGSKGQDRAATSQRGEEVPRCQSLEGGEVFSDAQEDSSGKLMGEGGRDSQRRSGQWLRGRREKGRKL